MRRIACSLCSASAALVALALAASPAGAATTAGSCLPATTQAFAGDTNQYFLLSGGSFETGAPPWSLTGGAARAAGNNTAGGDPSTNTMSLSLPAGSSATSPAVCVTPDAPTIRFYVSNTGAASSRLGVTVLFTLPNGWPMSWQVAQISGTAAWQPSAPIYFFANLLANASPTGTTNVSFQFRPLDAAGQWRVDDVYVDPFKRH